MDSLTLIAEICKYILPALAVLGGVWMVLGSIEKREAQKESLAIRGQALSKIIPLRLQAYERAILFLERIAPENLLMRIEPQGKKAKDFWLELQGDIRAEYEHNLAQQLYISPDAWTELVKAKENVLTLINQCGKSVPPATPAIELGRRIMAVYNETGESPTIDAIHLIKVDLQKTFRMIK